MKNKMNVADFTKGKDLYLFKTCIIGSPDFDSSSELPLDAGRDRYALNLLASVNMELSKYLDDTSTATGAYVNEQIAAGEPIRICVVSIKIPTSPNLPICLDADGEPCDPNFVSAPVGAFNQSAVDMTLTGKKHQIYMNEYDAIVTVSLKGSVPAIQKIDVVTPGTADGGNWPSDTGAEHLTESHSVEFIDRSDEEDEVDEDEDDLDMEEAEDE